MKLSEHATIHNHNNEPTQGNFALPHRDRRTIRKPSVSSFPTTVSVIFKRKDCSFQMIENWIAHPGRQWHWDLFNKAEIFARIASHPIFPTIIGGAYLNWNNRRRGEPLPIIAEILGRNFQLGSIAVNTVFPGGTAMVRLSVIA